MNKPFKHFPPAPLHLNSPALMASIRSKLLSGNLEASDFIIKKQGIQGGKMMIDITIPGVRFTRFRVDYVDEEQMIISYRYWGILKRHILHLPLKKSDIKPK